MPIQQMLLGVGSATKTYIEDLFTTVLYTGTGSSQTISTGINQSGEGALTWIKERSGTQDNILVDSVRGPTKRLVSNGSGAQSTDNSVVHSFTSSGFTVGNSSKTNDNGETFASWTFRKAPGWFTIKEYSGTGSNQNISHDLGSVPGCIMIKRTDASSDWIVYHRGVGPTEALRLDSTSGAGGGSTRFNDTAPTASVFTVGTTSHVNASGGTYIAYLFAGGEATGSQNRSVNFSDDNYLAMTGSSLATGTGLFTLECWVKLKDTSMTHYILETRSSATASDGFAIYIDSGLQPKAYNTATGSFFTNAGEKIAVGSWNHIAVVRDATNSMKLYVNGVQSSNTHTGTQDWTNGRLSIASESTEPQAKAYMSNVRLTLGQALYTSAFKPPTTALTTTSQGATASNVKILCCNGSTNGAYSSGTQQPEAGGSGHAAFLLAATSVDSPFDDSAGFVFGENEDQNAIKCGSYKGSGSSNATYPNIDTGWEPQFLIIKQTSSSGNNWRLFDSVRGMTTGDNDAELYPSSSTEEDPANEFVELIPNGFRLCTTDSAVNSSGQTYVYIAIRRSDGYIGKAAETAASVLNVATRAGSSSNALSNVNVFTDFSFIKNRGAAGEYWATNARLMGKYSLKTNATSTYLTGALPTTNQWDRMLGHMVAASNGAANSPTGNMIDYGFKRHPKGFDAVMFRGRGGSQTGSNRHSLGVVPEMMWIKPLNVDAGDWVVYHKGLNGGTNPEQYHLHLNTNAAEDQAQGEWNNTAPTAESFSTGTSGNTGVGGKNKIFLTLLFASVNGISKVGSYTGTGSSLTITTGFQPRFVLIKKASGSGANRNWYVLDTARGWASGNDKILLLSDDDAETDDTDMGAPTSTGFTLTGETHSGWNASNCKYIYYAHA